MKGDGNRDRDRETAAERGTSSGTVTAVTERCVGASHVPFGLG